jgi:RNA polymerase sigma-70 factor (ECF subfamily)
MEHAATAQSIPEAANTAATDFDAIVRAYQLKVFRFLLASLRDRDAAETLTQDCFVKAYRTFARFRGECSLSTWLMQIAVNLARDHARNRRLQFWNRAFRTAPQLEFAANQITCGEASPETKVLLQEEVGAVWNAAAMLPERQRTVFLLRFVEDMDLLEIATATGMKEGTVKTHLSRALHAVRKRIGVKE